MHVKISEGAEVSQVISELNNGYFMDHILQFQSAKNDGRRIYDLILRQDSVYHPRAEMGILSDYRRARI